MPYCQYCGKKLGEHEHCTCRTPSPSPVKGGGAAVKKLTARQRVICIILTAAVLLLMFFAAGAAKHAFAKPLRLLEKGINRSSARDVMEATLPDDTVKDILSEQDALGSGRKAYLAAYDAQITSAKVQWEAVCGRHPKLKIEVLERRTATAEERITAERDFFDTDRPISKVYAVKVKCTVKGRTDEESVRGWVYVVRFKGGGWRVLASSLRTIDLLSGIF